MEEVKEGYIIDYISGQQLKATPEEVEDFLAAVRAAEIQITIRNPRGRDILAACGQLAYKKEGK